jgi:cytochrome c oxidase assembly factor CtaG
MDPAAAAVLASWSFNWQTLGLLSGAAVLYLRGWRRLHAERPHKYTSGRLAAFLGGLIALLLALLSPVDALGGFLLMAHMVQHLLLLMVAPPLLLLGQPAPPILRGLPRWIFRDALGPFLACRELKQIGRVAVHPIVSWCVFVVGIAVWHLPPIYELALHSQAWHEVEHAYFFWSAIAFWWPVVGVWPGDPVRPRWALIPYLALADIVNTGLSAVLTFSDHVLYPTYRLAPRLWGISALDDQAAAGAIMWVPGSIAFLLPAAILGMRALDSRRRPAPVIVKQRASGPHTPARAPVDFFGPVLRYRHFRRWLQCGMLLLAAAVVADGFLGPQVSPMNLAGVLPWTYWRGFAVIALLLAGNLFCMACPFTLPRDLARKFLLPRYRWPRHLRSKWIAAGLLAAYLWAYEAFALWDSPRATAWIILGYFVAAFAVDILFRGASFCKYVCPIGQFHFVHALVSPFEVGVRETAVCERCVTHDCIRGNARQRGCELHLFQPKKVGNFDCTFCMDCVQACPQQNVSLLHVLPAGSLREDQRGSGIGRLSRRPDVAAMVLILVFGAFVNAAGMTDPVMLRMHYWHARLGSMISAVTAFYVCGLVVLPAILTMLCVWLSRQAAGKRKDAACSFVLALVPVGFGMWLAHFSDHLVMGWSSAVPALERLLWRATSVGYPLASTPSWLAALELLFLGVGLLLSLQSAWRVACRITDGCRMALAAMWPWAVLAAALYSAGVWIVFQPMQMRGTMAH